MNNPIIQLRGLVKAYGDNTVVKGINLDIKAGSFVTILGPSGCGKTTILRMIGGFEYPDAGDILFEGKSIKNLPANKRDLNTVFQKYALFPHMDVFDNVAFGLTLRKKEKNFIKTEVSRVLKLVGLEGFEKRKITQLSGGQQQRIAIARAIINQPKILLLDEPLAALDLKLRKEMQRELKDIHKKLGITFIFVTHDQEEALSLSDSVIVMKDGNILQQGTPKNIYDEPINAFVADFIGENNIFPGIMHKDFEVEFAGHRFVCEDKGFRIDEEVEVVVRPEDIDVVPKEMGDIVGFIESVIFKGVHYEITLKQTDGTEWLVHTTDYVAEGQEIGLKLTPNDMHVMQKSLEEKNTLNS